MAAKEVLRKAESLPGLDFAPSTAEIAWAAGLFEGEGSAVVCFQRLKRGSSERGKPYLQLTLSSTDLDVLQRLQRLVGGRLNGPYQWGDKRKPIWRWQMTGQKEVDRVVCLLFPWLGARRQWQVRNGYLRVGRGLPFEGGE
jgi:hypothetical protein